MKTVRLPIYDDGIMTKSYLEVDLTFWLSSTAGLRSNQARVVEPERIFDKILKEQMVAKREVLDRLAPSATEEARAKGYIKDVRTMEEIEPPSDWRTLEGLPTKSFQINERGQIRHKFNQKIIEPSLDLDSKNYMTVCLKINGLDWFINGPKVAEQMWEKV